MPRLAPLAIVWMLLSSASVLAAAFTVDSTMDAVDATPGDGVCATAGPGPVCTLRAAIQEASALAGADTITIPAGTYTLTIGGTGEDAAATGDLDINDPSGMLTLNGASSGTTIIDGGGIDRVFHVLSDATISGVTIQNGHAVADFGGGLYNVSSGSLTLSNVVITGNTADQSGGGLENDSGTVTLDNVTVSDNTATTGGGGIKNADTMVLDGVTISGNAANTGGGLNHDGFDLTLTNVTVSGNTAYAHGGGITDNVGAMLTNVTISGNSSNPGGATGGNFYYLGIETFMNVIVSNSVAGNSCTSSGGTLTSNGHNLDGGNTCGFTGPGDLINTNPRLGPLQDNGGPTFTMALLPGSPAIDAGASCPSTDQRGFPRVDGNGDGTVVCDIGAFEFGSSGPGTTTTTTIVGGTTTTTTLPSCSLGATFASIECRLGVLMATVGTSVPAGALHDGLEKSVTKATRLTGQAEGAPKRKAKRMLGMAAGAMGKFKARLHTAKAKRTVGDALNGLVQTAGQIQSDLRTLRGSL